MKRSHDLTRLPALLPLLALGAVLSACGDTRAPATCGMQDWNAVGFVDGAQGRDGSAAARHAGCAGFDRAAWTQGYLSGLPSYCTEARVYRNARIGLSFPRICTPLEAELAAAHAHGRRYFELDEEMRRLRRRARDDLFGGQRLAHSAEFNALRRERALYSRWPP